VNLIRRIRGWLRFKYRQAALRYLDRLVLPLGGLRQFVYLDEVTLRSLYVGRYGAEDARIVETQGRSRESSLSAGASNSIPGVVAAKVDAGVRTTTSSSRQVERQGSKQSLFRDFLGRELRRIETESGADDLIWDATTNASPEGMLQRGRLVQVQVRLQADPLYRFGSMFGTIAELTKQLPEQAAGMEKAEAFGKLVQQLLINQVPLRAEVVDWGVDAGGTGVVRKADAAQPLYLQALMDTGSFWADERRFLFDEAPHTALVRLAEPGVVAGWTPLKLFNAMRNYPAVASINTGLQELTGKLEASASASEAARPDGDASVSLTAAFDAYLRTMVPAEQADSLATLVTGTVAQLAPAVPSATAVDATFAVLDRLAAELGHALPPGDDIAARRADALRSQGLTTLGIPASTTATSSPDPVAGESVHGLVGEVVALYW
jgi:hypothetical protein